MASSRTRTVRSTTTARWSSITRITSRRKAPTGFLYWGGFNISGIYRYITGAAWGRRAGIRGLDQGTETVRIEPRGTRRVDALNNFDLRVEKTFVLGGQQARTAGLSVDVFNVNNQGIADSESSRPYTDTSGSNFGDPRVWIDPRLVRVGVRFTF